MSVPSHVSMNLDSFTSDEKKVVVPRETKDTKQVIACTLDDSKEKDATIIFDIGCGNEEITAEIKFVLQSELIKTMIEGDEEAKHIPLPNVEPNIFNKVLEYMTHHHKNPPKEIERPIRSADPKECFSDWDAKFIDVDQDMLFQIILAANYLDMKPLLDLTCAKVASMMKGKSPEEIRTLFGIVNDFTPEEEAHVIAENKWAESN